ncbi:hypothetical protein BJ742DRAFT_772820 [Cladochytrium replicatum]|nr:hypothetical protein BJ742DRAFT_772820 [Cladochytrium replicatum]
MSLLQPDISKLDKPLDPFVLVGWAGMGIIVRAWALAIQRKPMLGRTYFDYLHYKMYPVIDALSFLSTEPVVHGAFAVGFGTLGYFFDRFERAALRSYKLHGDKTVKRVALEREKAE